MVIGVLHCSVQSISATQIKTLGISVLILIHEFYQRMLILKKSYVWRPPIRWLLIVRLIITL